MEARVNKNLNVETNAICFGISIRVDGGHRYCKYPVEHQEYASLKTAHQAKDKLLKDLKAGAKLIFPKGVSVGLNKVEPVKVELA